MTTENTNSMDNNKNAIGDNVYPMANAILSKRFQYQISKIKSSKNDNRKNKPTGKLVSLLVFITAPILSESLGWTTYRVVSLHETTRYFTSDIMNQWAAL